MRHFGLWAALAAAAFPIDGFSQSLKMQVGGVARTYILHVPPGVATGAPLMFVLCGHGMTGADQQRDTKMDVIADREKFIVAYPDAIEKNWDQAGDSDFKFFLALIDTLDAKYHVDKNRIYAAGFSQGAGMTHGVGCGYADKFAAIAPVSGNIPANCKPARAIPMFLTFGTKDIATPEKFMSSASTWAKLDECPTTPTVTRPYPATNPNSLVTRISWGPCKNGTEVIADSIKDGPHEWPMNTATKVNNSEEVWAFFKKFTLSGSTALPRPTAARPAYRAIYANGVVRMQGTGERASVRILDQQGRLVAQASGKGEIDFHGQPPGVYRILVAGEGPLGVLNLVVP
jgi:poly(3-hydroxybutyrate) depolymerase